MEGLERWSKQVGPRGCGGSLLGLLQAMLHARGSHCAVTALTEGHPAPGCSPARRAAAQESEEGRRRSRDGPSRIEVIGREQGS